MNKTIILLSNERKTREGATFYTYKTEGKNGKIINVKFTKQVRTIPFASGKFNLTFNPELANIATKQKMYNGNEYTEVTLWVSDPNASFEELDSRVKGVSMDEYF